MPVRHTDQEIAAFLAERKVLPSNYLLAIQPKAKSGHKESELDVKGADGNQFRIVIRLNLKNLLDFSVILGVLPLGSNTLFRLRRYNGKSHEHTNKLEGVKFYDFHIHTATERYQMLGAKEESFAEPCSRYSAYSSALKCMLIYCSPLVRDCG